MGSFVSWVLGGVHAQWNLRDMVTRFLWSRKFSYKDWKQHKTALVIRKPEQVMGLTKTGAYLLFILFGS